MKNANWILKALLCTALLGCYGNALFGQSCEQMVYMHQNQIDPKPIELRQIRGTGVDPNGISIPQLCIGIFSEPEHTLLRFAQADNNGVFALETNGLPDGEYRLVIQVIGFCPANAIIQIKSRSHRKKSLVAKMRPQAVDDCSFIEVSRN
jgi:hypothetical protein